MKYCSEKLNKVVVKSFLSSPKIVTEAKSSVIDDGLIDDDLLDDDHWLGPDPYDSIRPYGSPMIDQEMWADLEKRRDAAFKKDLDSDSAKDNYSDTKVIQKWANKWRIENLKGACKALFSTLKEFKDPSKLKAEVSKSGGALNWFSDKLSRFKDEATKRKITEIFGHMYDDSDNCGREILATACLANNISPFTRVRCERCGAQLPIHVCTAAVTDHNGIPIVLCPSCYNEYEKLEEMDTIAPVAMLVGPGVAGGAAVIGQIVYTTLVKPLLKDWDKFIANRSKHSASKVSKDTVGWYKPDHSDRNMAAALTAMVNPASLFLIREELTEDTESNSKPEIESQGSRYAKYSKILNEEKVSGNSFKDKIKKFGDSLNTELKKFKIDFKLARDEIALTRDAVASEWMEFFPQVIDPLTGTFEPGKRFLLKACKDSGISPADTIWCEKCKASTRICNCQICIDVEGEPRIVCDICANTRKQSSKLDKKRYLFNPALEARDGMMELFGATKSFRSLGPSAPSKLIPRTEPIFPWEDEENL